MKIKRRLLYLVPVVAAAISLFSLVSPLAASAIDGAPDSSDQIKNGQFTWWDRNTIHASINGTTYYFRADYTSQNHLIYDVGNSEDQCWGRLDFDTDHPFDLYGNLSPNTTAPKSINVDMDYKPGGTVSAQCTDTSPNEFNNVRIGNPQNFNIFYLVNDDGRGLTPAEGYDGSKYHYTQSDKWPNIFTRDDESGKACQDEIIVNKNAGTYQSYELTTDDSSGKKAPDSLHAADNCYLIDGDGGYVQNGVDQKLGNAQNLKGDPNPAGGPTSPSDNADSAPACDASDNPLTWIICPVVDVAGQAIGATDKLITDQLTIDTGHIFCEGDATCQAYRAAWSAFRNISLGLMVIAGLIVVIAQAIGMEILDAYTIRKILPRLLVAAVGITLSWPLMSFFVTLSNDLGFGVRHLIEAPFSNFSSEISLTFNNSPIIDFLEGLGVAGAGVAGTAFLFSGAAGATLGILLSYILTAGLAVLVAILVLALRQIAVIMLIILSPIAIVAYILPNTQRVYKLWWESFSKALMMFPMIVAFIATGRVFSAIAIQSGGFLNGLIGFVAYFAPYFLIPLTFRFAGGAVRGIGGFVNDKSRGGFDRLSQARSNNRKKIGAMTNERFRSANVFRNAPMGSRRSKFNTAVQAATLIGEGGFNPVKMPGRIKAAQAGLRLAQGGKGLNEAPAFQPLKGDDDAAQAILHGRGSSADERAYLEAAGFRPEEIKQKMSHIALARRDMGQPALMQAAILSGVQASTAYDVDPITGEHMGAGRLLSDIDIASGGDAQTRAQLIGQVKSLAPSAGRPDLVGSFSTMEKAATAISRARTPAEREALIQQTTEDLADENVRIEGAGLILGGKGRAVEHFLPALQRRISRSVQHEQTTHDELERVLAGETVMIDDGQGGQKQLTEEEGLQRYDAAQRQAVQVLASTKALHDVAGQVSQEKATIIADGLFGQKIPGTNHTVLDAMNEQLDSRIFNEMRNEYRSNYGRQLTEQQHRILAATQPPPDGVEPPSGAVPPGAGV